MFFTTAFGPSTIDSLFEELFCNWPIKTIKPPIDHCPILDPEAKSENKLKGWNIQMALAGFTEEDVEVWHEGQTLHIKGSNQDRNVSEKFICTFYHKIPVGKGLDLTKTEVNLDNGLLDIQIPLSKKKENKRNILFGRK